MRILALALTLAVSTSAFAVERFVEPAFHQVGQAKRIKIQGVPFTLTTEQAADTETAEGVRLRIVSEKLTQAQLEKLNAYFKTRLAHDAQKNYDLVSFLTPVMQALEGRRFVGVKSQPEAIKKFYDTKSDEEFDKTDIGAETATNCWQTALELARRDEKVFRVYYPPEAKMAGVFRNEKLFKKIKRTEMIYGDLAYMYATDPHTDEEVARHGATFISDDVYFEKTGSDDRFLFRLVTAEQLKKDYDSPKSWAFLRRTGEALPGPESFTIEKTDPDLAKEINDAIVSRLSVETAFGQGVVSYSFLAMEAFRLVRDTRGKWTLEPAN